MLLFFCIHVIVEFPISICNECSYCLSSLYFCMTRDIVDLVIAVVVPVSFARHRRYTSVKVVDGVRHRRHRTFART